MRKSLVTQFVCASCGDYLSLSYDKPKHPSNSLQGEDYSITGACKVDNVIAVHPCERCFGEVKRPMEALGQIIKAAIGKD